LLYQVISRRYESKSLVLSTNLAFSDWPRVFPNAASAIALIDRVIQVGNHRHRGRELPEAISHAVIQPGHRILYREAHQLLAELAGAAVLHDRKALRAPPNIRNHFQ